eukprot:m.151775 g.151775  ORF g.151775 m.151775 type:complete len:352 (+) comp16905_c0_seq4:2629-3684(+)
MDDACACVCVCQFAALSKSFMRFLPLEFGIDRKSLDRWRLLAALVLELRRLCRLEEASSPGPALKLISRAEVGESSRWSSPELSSSLSTVCVDTVGCAASLRKRPQIHAPRMDSQTHSHSHIPRHELRKLSHMYCIRRRRYSGWRRRTAAATSGYASTSSMVGRLEGFGSIICQMSSSSRGGTWRVRFFTFSHVSLSAMRFAMVAPPRIICQTGPLPGSFSLQQSSIMVMPRLKMSADFSNDDLSLRSSGARYTGSPSSNSDRDCDFMPEMPKSPILRTPLVVRKMLAGLMSRCRMLLSWMRLRPSEMSARKFHSVVSSVNVFRCKLPSEQNSVWMKRIPRSSQARKQRTQ